METVRITRELAGGELSMSLTVPIEVVQIWTDLKEQEKTEYVSNNRSADLFDKAQVMYENQIHPKV